MMNYLFGKDKMSFREFIERFSGAHNHHWEQCSAYFRGHHLDCIGKVENFNEDIGKICEQIGIKKGQVFPHINKTHHKPYQDYYEKDLVEIVHKEFVDDIEGFGYAFNQS